MNHADVARHRLASQFLLSASFTDPADVVHALGAVQAQDYAGAKWAIGQRLERGTDDALEEAMTRGTILRTHALRPTWHFVTPADIRWMLSLTAPRVKRIMASYDARLSLSAAVYRRSAKVIARALEGGRHLTRTELAAALRKSGVDPGGTQRLAHLVQHAELDALICSGPRRGKQFTYALLDERAPLVPALARDEALFELTKRYFATRGPASAQDFAWWSGLTIADARHGIRLLGEALEEVRVNDESCWRTASGRRTRPALRSPVAHLLPNYDEYFIGFRDRGALGERLRALDTPVPDGFFYAHVITIDGQLVGGWTRTLGKESVQVALRMAVPLSAPERRAVRQAAARYAAFLGLRLDVV